MDTEAGLNRPPPSYTETARLHSPHGEPSDAPPSYDSLYGELRSVRSPSHFAVFAKKVVDFLAATIGAAIAVALVSIIPIIMTVVGGFKFHDCPAQDKLPLFLVVGGAAGILKSAINFYYRWRAERAGEPEALAKHNPLDGILNLFLFAWFVAGAVWVYRAYRPSFKEADYCDPLVFWLAFVLIQLTLLFWAMMGCLFCCCGCLALCCPCFRQERDV